MTFAKYISLLRYVLWILYFFLNTLFQLWINVLSFCFICSVSWQFGGGARGSRAAEGDDRALCPVGRCQRGHGRPKKPTWWQVQPHPGLRPLVFFFHSNAFFYFLKINTPTTLFLLIDLSPSSLTSHALTPSRPRTPVSSPSTLKPFVLILFFY